MPATYEFKCTPPNEGSRTIRITAHTLEEAAQRANTMWCRQMHTPILLCIITHEKQQALAF